MKRQSLLPRPRPAVLPAIWIISDARSDAGLDHALARLPRGSGLIFRHNHLSAGARRKRFERLCQRARGHGHVVILAGPPALARRWGADGAYGSPRLLARGPACLRMVTVHSLREIAKARRADAVLLSPVFATRSHPHGKPLGALRFRLIARHALPSVIALGGMNRRSVRRLDWPRWAGIDAFLR